MAIILSSYKLVDDIRKELIIKRRKLSSLRLVTLKFGYNSATDIYIRAQKKWAKELNIDYQCLEIPLEVKLKEVLRRIDNLNNDPEVKGIVIHKPLPKSYEESTVFEKIDPLKDTEGLHPLNLGRSFYKSVFILPPTLLSVDALIKSTRIDLYGKEVVIVGFSNILGKPLAILLGDRLATVSVTHIATYEQGQLPSYIRRADILISAVGKPYIIKGEWIKEGAVVIDVGISRDGGRVVGDIEFPIAEKRASYISPVPGGVGALTTAFLFKNLLLSAEMQRR